MVGNTRWLAAAVALWALTAAAGAEEAAHGIAMHGRPALAADFPHLPYADPSAPKGGRMTLGWPGSFDSLNPFTYRGVYPPGLREFVYESLLTRNLAEPFSLYGLVAESVETPHDRSSATFRLRPNARFSDGRPLGAADVAFSLELLRERGLPNQRSYYAKVRAVETPDERTVRFLFADGTDRELPLIIGLMPILPKHATDPATFEQTTLKPPVASGPYTVGAVEPGSSITYRRNPEYWGRDLPVNRGRFNPDEIRYDYFRDANALFEAFKRGLVDVRFEDDATRWIEGYDFPAAREGAVVKEALEAAVPKGLSAFVFNTRRPLFADRRVREALVLLFDFAWANQVLYRGAYERTESYFQSSELSALGIPASAAERALLAPFPAAVLPEVMEGRFRLPAADAGGRNREGVRRALALLRAAGYSVEGGALKDASGAPFAFEILVQTREHERLALNYAGSLKRAGIAVTIRQVDATQFEQRRKTFDFDMLPFFWGASLSPGNEQANRWSSAAAMTEGSFNLPGVSEPAADAMIAALLAARDRDGFVAAVRALDRVLMSGSYVLPLFHRPAEWVARWTRIAHPTPRPLTGYALDTWWTTQTGARP